MEPGCRLGEEDEEEMHEVLQGRGEGRGSQGEGTALINDQMHSSSELRPCEVQPVWA
jgi:hypothetical protein